LAALRPSSFDPGPASMRAYPMFVGVPRATTSSGPDVQVSAGPQCYHLGTEPACEISQGDRPGGPRNRPP
jgi:hypothetical protein